MIEKEIAIGFAWYIVFLFSVTFHEASHAWVAKLGGDLTAYEGGQVSLNPLPHIQREPFGMVLVPIVSLIFLHFPLGFASTPYNPGWAERHPKRSGLMALAGPVSNLVLVLLAFALIYLGISLHWWQNIPSGSEIHFQIISHFENNSLNQLALFVSMFFTLNLILAVLNILPFPPLDGSGVVLLLLDKSTSHRYMRFIQQPGMSFLGIIIAWNLFPRIFEPIYQYTLNAIYLL